MREEAGEFVRLSSRRNGVEVPDPVRKGTSSGRHNLNGRTRNNLGHVLCSPETSPSRTELFF